MKHHELSQEEWDKIREQIRTEFGPSMIMLRSRMRDELGFTPRDHRVFVPKLSGGYWDTVVHIDFYTESARTWFLLKFV